MREVWPIERKILTIVARREIREAASEALLHFSTVALVVRILVGRVEKVICQRVFPTGQSSVGLHFLFVLYRECTTEGLSEDSENGSFFQMHPQHYALGSAFDSVANRVSAKLQKNLVSVTIDNAH